jgi:hypothetical protein
MCVLSYAHFPFFKNDPCSPQFLSFVLLFLTGCNFPVVHLVHLYSNIILFQVFLDIVESVNLLMSSKGTYGPI